MKAKKMIVATVLLLAILVAFVGCSNEAKMALLAGNYYGSPEYTLILNSDGSYKISSCYNHWGHSGTYKVDGFDVIISYKEGGNELTTTGKWDGGDKIVFNQFFGSDYKYTFKRVK